MYNEKQDILAFINDLEVQSKEESRNDAEIKDQKNKLERERD